MQNLAFSPYKSLKTQIDNEVQIDGRAIVQASWLALRSIVRCTVNMDAPKNGTDDGLNARIGAKNLAWAHVADAWGISLAGSAFVVDADDAHYAAVRAHALAFRSAVVGRVSFAPTFGGFAAVSTKNNIEAALTIAVNGGN